MSFQLPHTMNKEKVFLVKRSELGGRLDPFCYIPSLVFLDNLIKSKTDNRLKDFAVGYSSGATPSKDESDIHYTSKEKGFPFVRVQNLSTTGELNFDNMKYITKETHNGLLNRSKVFAGDLLVKITGVGRMAVASVTPESFEGNINQHIVVIRTESVAISQTLAAFINLDCIEKLASKRATGGTRPALDYPALFSLPVISDERFSVKMAVASAASKQKEAQALQLLDSIDTYLLNELGIELPLLEKNTISQRMFVRKFSQVSGGRFDPACYAEAIENIKKQICQCWGQHYLKEIISDLYRYPTFYDIDYLESGVIVIKGQNIDKNGEISLDQDFDYIDADTHKKLHRTHVVENDLVFTVRGVIGKVGLYKGTSTANINANVMKIRLVDSVNIYFYWHYLNSIVGQLLIQNKESGQVQKTITVSDINHILIPIPPLEKQNEIAAHIQAIRNQAKQLRADAAAGLERAKREVEAMIIGRH